MEFKKRIRKMNQMYMVGISDTPKLLQHTNERLNKFCDTLTDELSEIDEIQRENGIDKLVSIADWLADITVYCRSEAMKYGIPLEEVIEIVMDSNESKLDENGNPIYDANGKFLKGPNYWQPEPKIKELLKRKVDEH